MLRRPSERVEWPGDEVIQDTIFHVSASSRDFPWEMHPGNEGTCATKHPAGSKNIREAITLYLESLQAHGDAVPPIQEEIVEIESDD